jgi:hypothetical protein
MRSKARPGDFALNARRRQPHGASYALPSTPHAAEIPPYPSRLANLCPQRAGGFSTPAESSPPP